MSKLGTYFRSHAVGQRRLVQAASFGIYGIGLAALSGSDLLVTRFFSSVAIADWAEVRSLVGISSILCLIGLDQVLIRSPHSSGRILKALAIQVPFLAVAVGLAIWAMDYLQNWILATALVAASAIGTAMAQYFRSHRLPIQSQLAQQGWRVAIFAAFAVTAATTRTPNVDLLVATTATTASIVTMIVFHRFRPSQVHAQQPETPKAIYALGVRFMITSLFLAFAIYAEQLIVSGIGTPVESAIYFTHATYFLFPAAALNGYFGFILGPWLRDHHNLYVSILKKRIVLICLASGAYASAMNLAGWIAWHTVSPIVGPVDPIVQILMLLTSISMTLYTLPSAYNGIFGRPREHDALILAQACSLVTTLAIFIILYFLARLPLIHSVAFASTANWGLRTLIGFHVTKIIEKNGAVQNGVK